MTVVPPGSATGIGSLPGDDIDAALALVFDELPEFPHLPELPARGPGADMIGRTGAALAGMHVDLQPSGWRVVPRAGVDERRATDLLARDLDALVEVASDFDGTVKVQLAGPWTLAAAVELPRGDKVLADHGAVRDLVASLADTAAAHLAEVRRRVPRAQLVLQLDEPSLPQVLAGTVPTASGFRTLRSIAATTVREHLHTVVAAAGVPVAVHCCAADVPLRLLHQAGVAAVSVDLGAGAGDRDAIGELVEAGVALWLGVVPALGPGVPPSTRDVADPVRRLWHELGFAPERLPATVTLTPACGLAGASEGWARTALRLVRQAARVLAEAPEPTKTGPA